MIDKKDFIPVRLLTLKGKCLVAVIRALFTIRRWLGFRQWTYLEPGHHEDPAHMNLRDALYMGYKYYFRAMLHAEKDSGLEDWFREQTILPEISPQFEQDGSITLCAGGDLIPYELIREENCTDFWEEAGAWFFDNDIVFANLESPAILSRPRSAAPEVMLNDMYFNISENCYKIFSGNGHFKGYDILSTANNHTLDMGPAGVLATMDFLRKKGIAWCGTAASPGEAENIPIIERQGIRIAFIAYTFSLNKEQVPADQPWLCNHIRLNEHGADISLIIRQAAMAREQGADLIVASLHMGCAYQVYPNMHTVKNMHRICEEAGVDIILGGHPHNMQPLEIINSVHPATGANRQHLIAYSLGDFVAFDIYKWCHLPLTLKLTISKGRLNGKRHVQLTGVEARPFYLYANRKRQLKLVDFLRVAEHPSHYFDEPEIIEEIKELRWFLYDYIFTEKQRHLLSASPAQPS